MLDSILPASGATGMSVTLCALTSLALGLGVAGAYMFRNRYRKDFAVTLALLPAMVQAVIMLINGSIGTGLAVAGAFSLVRFRSVPGGAREIGSIFFAVAIGLATGTGYVFAACAFLALVGGASLLLTILPFGAGSEGQKQLRITLPENLDYYTIFDGLFARYTHTAELARVKTSHMGSLYELQYSIRLKDAAAEKDFIDQLRLLNGNLPVALGRLPDHGEEL
jgi:hypothetical protein